MAAEGVARSDARGQQQRRQPQALQVAGADLSQGGATAVIAQIKWAMMAVTLSIYYLVPWLRWDRGPRAPHQAVLVDLAHERLYFFFIEIWPQEVYYITGLLILAAVSLFLINALFGRLWCGYSCPQTVWTDLFIWVETKIEGDRSARIRLAAAPWTRGQDRQARLQACHLAALRGGHRRRLGLLFQRCADACCTSFSPARPASALCRHRAAWPSPPIRWAG